MTQTASRHNPTGDRDAAIVGRDDDASWRVLYRTAGVAALVTAVLIPIQIAVFTIFPFPETVAGWFALLREQPLVGLVDLDLLLVVDNVLLVVIALAVYVALRRADPSVVLLATGLWLLAIVMFVASNPSVEMLALSGRFADATTAAERAASLGAGQALLAAWEGTAFHVAYVVGQLAGIVHRGGHASDRPVRQSRPLHVDHRQRRRVRVLPADRRSGPVGVRRGDPVGLVPADRQAPVPAEPRPGSVAC